MKLSSKLILIIAAVVLGLGAVSAMAVFKLRSTMIEERLTQCCVHVGTKSEADAHQCAPFCAVQAWPALSRQRLSTATTRRELQLLQPNAARS